VTRELPTFPSSSTASPRGGGFGGGDPVGGGPPSSDGEDPDVPAEPACAAFVSRLRGRVPPPRNSNGEGEAAAGGGSCCVICADELSDSSNRLVVTLSCDHTFHEDCLREWLTRRHTCPTCRMELEVSDSKYLRHLGLHEEADVIERAELEKQVRELEARHAARRRWAGALRRGEPVHFGLACGRCGLSPLIGDAFRCEACVSFVLCAGCHAVREDRLQAAAAARQGGSEALRLLPPICPRVPAASSSKGGEAAEGGIAAVSTLAAEGGAPSSAAGGDDSFAAEGGSAAAEQRPVGSSCSSEEALLLSARSAGPAIRTTDSPATGGAASSSSSGLAAGSSSPAKAEGPPPPIHAARAPLVAAVAREGIEADATPVVAGVDSSAASREAVTPEHPDSHRFVPFGSSGLMGSTASGLPLGPGGALTVLVPAPGSRSQEEAESEELAPEAPGGVAIAAAEVAFAAVRSLALAPLSGGSATGGGGWPSDWS